MKTYALKGELRNDLGKSATKQIRAKGMTPCVLYGAGENIHFAVYEADFKKLVYTNNTYLVRLDIDGNQVIVKLQDLQYHPVSESIIHADFLALDLSKPITIKLPIKTVGDSPGVHGGGRLRIKMKKLTVLGLVQDLPDFVEISVDGLELGQAVRVRDLDVKGFELLDTAENSIVSVVVTRAALTAEELEAEEAAEALAAEEAAEFVEGAEGVKPEEGAEGKDPAEENTDK